MIKLEHTETYGWDAAIRGMRNPMNSWDKSDSSWTMECDEERELTESGEHIYQTICRDNFVIGDNDLDLMMRLAKAGPVHAKYRRMITVTVDITAPLYWWKEFDTYKVGTVANSCSTMHKIHAKEFTIDDFSHEHVFDSNILWMVVEELNLYRKDFLRTNDKRYWWQMIQLLPTSYNQTRTVQMNYEVLAAMYRDRHNHKLDEWRHFCDWIDTLPYSQIITEV